MRKVKKAQDRVQLHLPVAARPYARVGRPHSLSGLNSYGAKEEEQEPQPWAWGIWICLRVVEDPGQTAAGLLGSSVSRGSANLSSSKTIGLSVGCGSFCQGVQSEGVYGTPWVEGASSLVSPGSHLLDVTLHQNELLHFNMHLSARL